MRTIALTIILACLAALNAGAFELTADDISVTECFVVEVDGNDLTIKNNLGTDAFKVYILLYTEDSFALSCEPKELEDMYSIPVLPDGFSVTLKGYFEDRESLTGVNKARAKVYYVREYY